MTWKDIASTDLMWDFVQRMAEPPNVVPTGLPTVDKAMKLFGDERGIPAGTYAIVGGASNVGKTQFGLAQLKQAKAAGQQAGMISLDMRPWVATARLYQGIVGRAIPLAEWLPSKWDVEETSKQMITEVRAWADRAEGDGRILIDVDCGRGLEAVHQSVRHAFYEHGVTYFVIDHMQKIKVDGIGGNAIAQRAEVVSELMDDLVDELEVTIVGLSQLNRMALADRNRQPTLSDLWGGTAMESNAGVVIILDHSRYERDREKHHLAKTYVLLEKNQQGPKGFAVPVEWNHSTLGIREADPHEEDSWPTHKKKGKK